MWTSHRHHSFRLVYSRVSQSWYWSTYPTHFVPVPYSTPNSVHEHSFNKLMGLIWCAILKRHPKCALLVMLQDWESPVYSHKSQSLCAARTVFQLEFHCFFMHITSLAVFLEISVAHGSITFCCEIFPSHCKFYTCSWAQLHTGGERREIIALFQNLVSCLESMFPHHRCTPDTKAFFDQF